MFFLYFHFFCIDRLNCFKSKGGKFLCGFLISCQLLHYDLFFPCSIWLPSYLLVNCRNYIVFNRYKNIYILQVINMTAHWIQPWAYLLLFDEHKIMVTECTRFLMVGQDNFSRASWQHIYHIRDVKMLYVVLFLMVDLCLNLMLSVICKLDIWNLQWKCPCASLDADTENNL